MSPWRMMNEWGTPPVETFQKAYEYVDRLAKKGKHVPDLVFAGGFTLEDHLFKGLAFGAPYVKAIGMARAPLTAVMSSSALWRRIDMESDQALIDKFGREKDEIYFGSTEVKNLVGDRFLELPAGALGVYTYYMRVDQGLRQLMAGARKFDLTDNLAQPNRDDLVALTKEVADISGIKYIMDLDKDKADELISKAENH